MASSGSPASLHNINQKFIDVIANMLIEQNRQLLEIISENEGIPVHELHSRYLKHPSVFHQEICSYAKREYKGTSSA
jgi:hypothetical protein